MYEKHFGLQKHPFTARPTGADVFVGPQTATTMAALKQALASPDAVVLVSGPAGAGKSTLVGKALDAIADTHCFVRVGRMSLKGPDALEFLLEELGTTKLPKGTIRQFVAFREKLVQLEKEGKRLVVVIEDAVLTGADTMAEIEALTAGDGGSSGGAAIVAMGDERLRAFLQEPQLARLMQRIRQHHQISTLSPAELRGYLAHCLRRAGKEFDEIFDTDAVSAIHELCRGNPRIANTLIETVLAAAAVSGMSRVNGRLAALVGSKQLGLDTGLDMDGGPQSAPGGPETVGEPDPVTAASGGPEAGLLNDQDIQEFYQDTLPDLEVLAPEAIEGGVVTQSPGSDHKVTMSDAETPPPAGSESSPEPVPVPESAANQVPEWERDPTLAELRPDLDALERAMAFAHGDEDESQPPVLEPLEEAEPMQPAPDFDEIPEITLDDAIQQRVENSLIDEPGSVSASEQPEASAAANDVPEVRIPAKNARKADQEIEKISAELAKAKSIEDVDDRLAETLFGEEFSLVAAQVVAHGTAGISANDGGISSIPSGAGRMAQAAGTPVSGNSPFDDSGVEVSLETRLEGGDSGLDLSASQRLKTVRALSADPRPYRAGSAARRDPVPDVPAKPAATPDPIEDQINTSMTQTLKALNVMPPISDHDELDESVYDDEDERKGGFFSRFRRS